MVARRLADHPISRRAATLAALVTIVLFPLNPLLRPHAHFGGDYETSTWMVGYICEYLKLYHHPPNVFDTTESLGMAFPVFYGVLFYRFLGLLALLVGPNLAIHLVLLGGAFVEVGTVYRAARALRSSVGVALLFCLGIAGSTYQLTNVYNRGDLPEFFGFTLATTALAGWFWSRAASGAREVWLCRAIIAAALTLMAGTHSITMVLGGRRIIKKKTLTLLAVRRRVDLVTYGIALTALLIGAAIPITGYLLVGHQIRFAPGPYQFGFGLYSDRIDSPAARFSLFPYDPATLYNGVQQVSTPYLEAPIDYALLVFAAGVLLLRRDFVALFCATAAVFVAVASVWPRFWDFVPGPFHFFQFTYRLTNYVNFLSFAAALAVLWRLPDESRRVGRTPLPWVLAAVAVLACLIKLNHASLFVHDQPGVRPIGYYTDLGPIAPASANYITLPQSGSPVPIHPAVPPVGMMTLGQPEPQSYRADRSGFIYTRILVMPWNTILVDGDPLPDDLKIAWPDTPYYGIRERPGSRHVVDTYFALPTILDRAIRLAEYAFIFELGAIIAIAGAWIARTLRAKRVARAASMNA